MWKCWLCVKSEAAMFSTTSGFITLTSVFILLKGAQAQYGVTLNPQNLCAVIGSTVKISCNINSNSGDYDSIKEREWSQISGGETRVLNKDPQNSERVSVNTWGNDCELTVMNVRFSDSGVYKFRFRTSNSDWISASSGVNLTVTDLQVKVEKVGRIRLNLTCSSTCRLSTYRYNWYRNVQYKTYADYIELDSTSVSDEGSYSCGVFVGSYRSPPVCISSDSKQQNCWSVTYTPQSACVLIGSSVEIHSYYTFPDNHNVTRSVWFIKDQTGVEPVDLSEDEEYQGRVQYSQNSLNDRSMRISHLRESDAQTYRFIFYTDAGEKFTGQPGVTLTVTDLKVTVSGRDLTCSTTCTLSNILVYIWYKNGQPVFKFMNTRLPLSRGTKDAGSYSCAVDGHEELRSPAVCVFDKKSCWSVTYRSQTVCALIGSSVEIHSYYTFPDQEPTPQVAWYIRTLTQDKELSHAEKRVEFFSDRANMSSMRLKHLTDSDSAQYLLQFKPPYRNHTHSTGVRLSVTGLQVKVEPGDSTASEGQTVRLNCSTSCTLSNNPTYIWYRNGQRVSDCRSASCTVAVVSSAVNYSCAVEGHESLLSPPVCIEPRWTKSGKQNAVWGAVAVVPAVVLSLLTAILCIRRKRRAEGNSDVQRDTKPGDETYTPLNLMTTTSDHDTLQTPSVTDMKP